MEFSNSLINKIYKNIEYIIWILDSDDYFGIYLICSRTHRKLNIIKTKECVCVVKMVNMYFLAKEILGQKIRKQIRKGISRLKGRKWGIKKAMVIVCPEEAK